MCAICSLTIEFTVEHPLALSVAVATRQGIDSGVLPEPADPDMSMADARHEAILLLTGIQQRLERVLSISQLVALPTFYILMVESGTWGYFEPTSEGFDQKATPSSPRLLPDDQGIRDSIVLLSHAAAREIIEGRLPYRQACDDGMLIVDAVDQHADFISSAFGRAYSSQEFSHFVCAEVA